MSAALQGPDTLVMGHTHDRARANISAVLVGAVVAVTVGVALAALGTAIGAGLVDATERSTPSATSMAVGTGAWLLVSNLIGLFVGGTVAGRLSGGRTAHDGGLHGLGVWGVASLFMLTVMGGLVGQVGGAVSSMVGGAASSVASGVTAAAGSAVPSVDPQAMVARVRAALTAPENPAQMNSEQRAAEMARLLATRVSQGEFTGTDRQRLGQLIAAEANIPVEEANRRIAAYEADAQRVARETEEKARVAADATAKAASLSAWWFFATMLLGALAAWFGATRGWAAPMTSERLRTSRI